MEKLSAYEVGFLDGYEEMIKEAIKMPRVPKFVSRYGQSARKAGRAGKKYMKETRDIGKRKHVTGRLGVESKAAKRKARSKARSKAYSSLSRADKRRLATMGAVGAGIPLAAGGAYAASRRRG